MGHMDDLGNMHSIVGLRDLRNRFFGVGIQILPPSVVSPPTPFFEGFPVNRCDFPHSRAESEILDHS